MEWEKAKNYILIAFIILNAGLAILLHLENRRYTMTSDRDRNINIVLGRNNISLYTIPIRRFPPMRPLDVSGFYYDVPTLLEIFFENGSALENLEDDPYRWHFREGYSELTISNGLISFDFDARGLAHPYYEYGEITPEEAAALSGEFIGLHFPDFVHDITFEWGDGIRRIYRQKYRGRLIYSNYAEFYITSHGIEWIDMMFGRIIGHVREPQMIFAPDEVLLTFMHLMRDRIMEEHIFIMSMDMVYLQEYVSTRPGIPYAAVPTYRIFIEGSEDEPFLINAFTNMMPFR
ncbi:MAG: hypothetical protein FWB91_01030 [Defluviitaleaceae bacterium]|nr:hypothetical protein [Defluviitaleaceae bacterium]